MSVKEKYPDITTNRGQRMAIWVICIVMTVGFVAGFFIMVISMNNPSANPNQISYEKALEKQKKEQEAQAALTAGYQVFVEGYDAEPFDAAAVMALNVETLREGDGAEVTASDTITANYTGWTPDGKLFDTTRKTVDGGAVPIDFPLSGVIEGWTTGLTGRKVGGLYRLTIPAAQAYGEQGSGTSIPPNSPLRFIVEIVKIVE
ncbi:MAG: FKBP-type peptidyl-prolyl cis-trans isomerase [Candidatus Nomurabacteria bacterium]|jgi:FKBP-type peptidyl-prolyl cis-trans isomerase|nr:FKBP-type peptidyl-prolyl cis-trans isomerase [Candidatus Nomurabacteria bacterium]